MRLLENRAEWQNGIKTIIRQREALIRQIKTLPIVKHIFPSDTNFILVRFERAKEVYRYLTQKGIIVRDRTSALHCEDCLRITVGTEEENAQLIEALREQGLNS